MQWISLLNGHFFLKLEVYCTFLRFFGQDGQDGQDEQDSTDKRMFHIEALRYSHIFGIAACHKRKAASIRVRTVQVDEARPEECYPEFNLFGNAGPG